MSILVLILHTTLFFSLRSVTSSPGNHRYNVGDFVPLFVNKVGPLHNPSETYEYYDLPFCRPDNVIRKKETLGEVLNGDRLSSSLYDLKFREDKTGVTICNKKLKGDEILRFRDAINNDFHFQMYYDDLPLWGFIGKVEEQSWLLDERKLKYYLFKHLQFDILYNGNRINEVSAFSDPNHAVDITEDVDIDVEFTYSVLWNATSAPFDTRMSKYSRASVLPIHQQIHWFSFVNSVVIILLLMGLLTGLFMRRLKNDLRKCSGGDEEEDKEVGWKYIHGDVFRCPQNMPLFSAVLGMGTQLLTMICLLFVLASVGVLYPYNRGALCTSFVLVYTLTSVVGGYSAASFHNQFTEAGWKRSVLLTGILYLGPLFAILSILNIIAISYGATAAIPFGTITAILLILLFLTVPLLALGGVIGYHFRSEFQAPSATKRYPREIPPLAWYRKAPPQMFLAGLLSCSAVVLELHHLYTSLWGYKICTLPSILFVTFIILILLTAILSVGMTYIQLSAEDHQWWWRSVLCGGSPAIFMFSYSIFFLGRSSMSGFMQLSFFTGYNACCNMDYTHFSSKKQESTTGTSKSIRRILSSPAKTNINSQRLLQKLSKNQEPHKHELKGHQELLLESLLSSPKVEGGEKDASRNDLGGRERLKRHREEVGGQVIIPENWSQENCLKDWIDYSSFDNLLAPNGIASAREALMAESLGRRSSSQRLRIGSRC